MSAKLTVSDGFSFRMERCILPSHREFNVNEAKIMVRKPTERRAYWVAELAKLSDSFTDDAAKLHQEMRGEFTSEGKEVVLDHLRLCGAIPEEYGHDSSAEKLYSKYTDTVICESFTAIGLNASVIEARADTADVQARAESYSLVADAKAFRLSRTAKNQKDFKVQAMDGWRNGLDFAIVVAPIYQLPGRKSQIYEQAINRNVCVLSYSHIAALVRLALEDTPVLAVSGLHNILRTVNILHPSQDASNYWGAINKSLVSSLGKNHKIWTEEKTASEAGLQILKHESLRYLTLERDRLLKLSHQEALSELIKMAGVTARIQYVESVTHGSLLGL